MSKKLFTKVVSLSLAAAMVLSMAPVGASAAKKKKAKEVKPKTMKLTSKSKASKIKVGETKTIVATRKQKKTTAKVKYVKFTPKKTKNIGIKVTTSDDAVVSVEELSKGKYTYTGVTAGTATLTITSRAKTAKKKTLKAKLAVTVISPFRVTQTGSHTFTMSTADKLEKAPDAKDIMVKQEGSEIDNAVKEVKLSADKMAVEVTMHVPFLDQKKYEVTFGKEKDSFVASVGVPATINITTQTAITNKATKIEYAVLDAKGIDVTKTIDENKITVSASVSNGVYDTKKNEITLYKLAATAEARVVYHTWTYDEKTGKENIVEGKGTITAVDKSDVTVTGIDKYTIGKTVLSWDTDEMISMIPEKKTKYIFVRMKKSDNTYVDNLGKEKANFKFTHTGASILTVNETGEIYGFRQGTAYVKVVYTDYNVKYEYTLPVTVGAPSSPSSILVSPNYVTIYNESDVKTPVIAQVKDQYHEVLEVEPSHFTFDYLSGAKVAKIDTISSEKTENMRIGVLPDISGTTGSGNYKVTYDKYGVNLNTTLSVNSIKVNTEQAPVSYLLKPVDATEFDATITPNTPADDIKKMAEGISFELYKVQNNVITGSAVDVIGLYQNDDPKDRRIASVSVDGHSITDEDIANGGKFDPSDSDFIKVGPKSNQFTVYPVILDADDIKDAKNVLLTQKAGNHTLRVSFWVKDKEDPTKFTKVVLSAPYTVVNATKDGKEGDEEDYKIEKKINLLDKNRNAVGMAKKVVIPIKATPLANGVWEKDFFYVASSGTGEWWNNYLTNYPKGDSMMFGEKYNLDTAPVPTYMTAKDKLQVWTLKEKIARDVELVPDAIISIANIVMTAKDENNTTLKFEVINPKDKQVEKLIAAYDQGYSVYYIKKESNYVTPKYGIAMTADWTALDKAAVQNGKDIAADKNTVFQFALAKDGKFITEIGFKKAVVDVRATFEKLENVQKAEFACFDNSASGGKLATFEIVGKDLTKENVMASIKLDGANKADYEIDVAKTKVITKNQGKLAKVSLEIKVADGHKADPSDKVTVKVDSKEKDIISVANPASLSSAGAPEIDDANTVVTITFNRELTKAEKEDFKTNWSVAEVKGKILGVDAKKPGVTQSLNADFTTAKKVKITFTDTINDEAKAKWFTYKVSHTAGYGVDVFGTSADGRGLPAVQGNPAYASKKISLTFKEAVAPKEGQSITATDKASTSIASKTDDKKVIEITFEEDVDTKVLASSEIKFTAKDTDLTKAGSFKVKIKAETNIGTDLVYDGAVAEDN